MLVSFVDIFQVLNILFLKITNPKRNHKKNPAFTGFSNYHMNKRLNNEPHYLRQYF